MAAELCEYQASGHQLEESSHKISNFCKFSKLCPKSTINLLTALFVLWATLCQHAVEGANIKGSRHSVRSTSQHSSGVQLKVDCGYRICDLRTHYCDKVINNCARCDDDCHPGRINGDLDAIAECQMNCKHYYEYKTSVLTQQFSSTTSSMSNSKNSQSNVDHMSDLELKKQFLKLFKQVEEQSNQMESVQMSMTLQSISVTIIAVLFALLVIVHILYLIVKVCQERNYRTLRTRQTSGKLLGTTTPQPPSYDSQDV